MKPLEQLKQKFYTGALPIFSGIGWELMANHSEVTPSGREWSSDFIVTKGNNGRHFCKKCNHTLFYTLAED